MTQMFRLWPAGSLNSLLESALTQRARPFDPLPRGALPEKAGLYTICERDAVVYVGVTDNLNERLRTHRQGPTKNSQFRRNLRQIRGLSAEADITSYVKANLRFCFVQIDPGRGRARELDRKLLELLEYLLVALLNPELNAA